jgi:hypothetical protein
MHTQPPRLRPRRSCRPHRHSSFTRLLSTPSSCSPPSCYQYSSSKFASSTSLLLCAERMFVSSSCCTLLLPHHRRSLSRCHTTPRRVPRRCRVVLATAAVTLVVVLYHDVVCPCSSVVVCLLPSTSMKPHRRCPAVYVPTKGRRKPIFRTTPILCK